MARSRPKSDLSRSNIIKALRSCQKVQQRAQIICQHRLAFHGVMTSTQLLRIERYCQANNNDEFNQLIDGMIINVIAQKWQVALPRLSSLSRPLTVSQYKARANQKYVDADRMIRKQRSKIRWSK